MTDKCRSFAWALEPVRDNGRAARWWLVEMEDGEPRRAFLPPQNRDAGAGGRALMLQRAWRDSFVQWSKVDVPADAPAKLAPVHTYMGQRCVLENRR